MYELESLSIAELRALARQLRMPGASRLRKAELVRALGPHAGQVAGLLAGTPSETHGMAPQVSRPTAGQRTLRPEAPAPMTSTERPSPDRPSERAADRSADRPALDGVHDDQSTAETRGVDLLGGGLQSGGPLGTGASGAGRQQPVPVEPPRIVIPDLPWAYEDDRLVLLVRDPRTAYAYWDFHPDTLGRAAGGLPGPHAILRLFVLGGSEPKVAREVEVHLDIRNYYFFELEPNRDYRLEVVLRGANGEERLVGRASNVITLPPNHPSAWVEDRFVTIPLDIPLPEASLFAKTGRQILSEGGRLHGRAYELSGGELERPTGDEASSSRGIGQGFGGRSWSGTLIKK